MTSKPTTQCYIFVDIDDQAIPAAVYAINDAGLGQLRYGAKYLERSDAFSLDPINLPLSAGDQVHHPRDGKERFGVLSDATPDNWGRRLVMSLHRQPPRNEIEWLISSQGNGVGCLVPSLSKEHVKRPRSLPSFADLSNFMDLVEQYNDLADAEMPPELAKLIDFGSSMGGARPKAVVLHEGKEWIAKINRKDDHFDNARVEYASMRMAALAGVEVPETQLHVLNGLSVVLVERFDRNVPERKRHYLSANSVLNFEKIKPEDVKKDYSYMGLARVIRKISASPKEDLVELYRRMVFNILTGNTDDHLKNHGFVMVNRHGGGQYRLSPAFDLVPHLDAGKRLQAIGCGPYGRESSIENALGAREDFLLSENEARAICDQVQEVVKDWRKHLVSADVGIRDLEILKPGYQVSVPGVSQGTSFEPY